MCRDKSDTNGGRMPQIDYFFSVISPFTYLAGDGLEKIADRHGAEVTYSPFDIMKVFERTGGTPPAQRHPSRQTYRLQELARLSKLNDMPINLQPAHFPTNPAPASYAIVAAQSAGGGDVGALVRAVLRACWAEEKDIAQDEVVAAALDEAGFDPGLATSGLMQGAEAYHANTEAAVVRGVFGSPTYLTGDQVFWGQDRLAHLDAHLDGRC